MKRAGAVLLLVLMFAVLAACSSKSEAPKLAVSAPAAANLFDSLPAIPHWPEPGLKLLGGPELWNRGYAYAALNMDGMQIQPVSTPDGILYFTQKDNAVYLVGMTTDRDGYYGLEQPLLLYQLPLKVGDQWQIARKGQTYRVVSLDKFTTPGGEKVAAQIEVTGENSKLVRREWWVPGYGLIKTEDKYQEVWVAVKEERETPRKSRHLGTPKPGMTAILWDDGKAWTVVDVDTHKELFRVKDDYWRSWYSWTSVGTYDVLGHASFPGSWGIYYYSALLYDHQTAKFAEIPWISNGVFGTHVAGDGQWKPGGSFSLRDHLSYPVRYYTYTFDGKAMQSDPAAERAEYAKSPEALVRRLVSPPPLSRAAFISMFETPLDGERAYALLKGDPNDLLQIQADPVVPDGFEIGRSPKLPLVRVQVALRNGQYKIHSVEAIEVTGPLGERDKEILGINLETMERPQAEKVLGPSEKESRSPATFSYSRTYQNGKVTVNYLQDSDKIASITVTGAGKTVRGVGIGDTADDVLKRYPLPDSQSDIQLTYYDNGKAGSFYQTFSLEKGVVTRIELRWSK